MSSVNLPFYTELAYNVISNSIIAARGGKWINHLGATASKSLPNRFSILATVAFNNDKSISVNYDGSEFDNPLKSIIEILDEYGVEANANMYKPRIVLLVKDVLKGMSRDKLDSKYDSFTVEDVVGRPLDVVNIELRTALLNEAKALSEEKERVTDSIHAEFESKRRSLELTYKKKLDDFMDDWTKREISVGDKLAKIDNEHKRLHDERILKLLHEEKQNKGESK
jgi:hypothetical protein